MMLTLQRYDLKVKYRPGVELLVVDALSRSYLQETTETLILDLEVNEVHLTTHLPISPEKYIMWSYNKPRQMIQLCKP